VGLFDAGGKMSVSERKVYDYEPDKVRDRLVDVFRKRRGEATTADLVALTGLPTSQVETEIKAVSDEYGARLRVTDSGEILYSFPAGMKSRYRGFGPSLRRGWKAFRKVAAKVATFVFKIWTVVMLVGYFVLFLALALLALLASVAVSMSGNSRDSRSSDGGIGGLFLAGNLLDTIVRIWFYSELFMTPEERNARSYRRRERKPLYKAIYSFLFGDGDPDAGWDTVEKKAFVAFVQTHKGIIAMPEFMAITGLGSLEAEERINRFLYEFGGSPEVTEGGTIYYSFPSLMRRKDRADRTFGNSVPMRRLALFSSNPKKANRTFCVFNAVNLLFGSYFFVEATGTHTVLAQIYGGRYADKLVTVGGWDGFYYFTHQLFGKLVGMAHPAPFLAIALGIVPLTFSLFFYAIPAIRARRLTARNERARTENLRRVAYRTVLDAQAPVRPESIIVYDDAARPKDGRAAERVLTELAAWSGAEPGTDGSFHFDEIARGKAEVAKAREAVDLASYDLGGVSFDSDAPAN
jgi:hypothetical protein